MANNLKRKNMGHLAAFLTLSVFLTPSSFAGSSFDHRHGAWGEFLSTHTDRGFVDYAALAQASGPLDGYLDAIAAVSPAEYGGWSDAERIAFWINAYNAAAIRMVADHYPLKRRLGVKALVYPENSIQQIPDVWDRKAVQILGTMMSLNDIEHGTLRKQFQEPRIHFALVCASLGCPALRSEPYVPDQLDRQLDDQVRGFLSDPEKARYDAEADTLRLSPIFKWFRKDFDAAGGVTAFVKAHFPDAIASKVSDVSRISWLDYDWSLNEL